MTFSSDMLSPTSTLSHPGCWIDVLELSDEVACLHALDSPARAIPTKCCIHYVAVLILRLFGSACAVPARFYIRNACLHY